MLAGMTDVDIEWRGRFTSTEANRLHANAFGGRLYTDDEWDWVSLVEQHSLGWVSARVEGDLVGFANVISDGLAHAWLQDVMVEPAYQQSGIGSAMIRLATEQCQRAGCEWLHVDFDDDVADFYYRRCGFQRTNGGLLYLA
jgi:GNAT superfamily N-acetyltransferase